MSIEKVIADHELWLSSRGVQGAKAKLSGMKLTGLVLEGKDLSHADFEATKLTDVCFRNCNLSFLYAPHSQWTSVDCSSARLTCVSFRESLLVSCDFTAANLYFMQAVDSMWRDCSLDKALLKNADLTRAKLTNSPLDRAYLADTILTGSTIRDKDSASIHYLGKSLIKRG